MCGSDHDFPTETYRTPSCLQPNPAAGADGLVVENFRLKYDGYVYAYSQIAYVKGRPPSPLVLVYPNYAGLKQFDVDQAAFLARAGYVGLAVDLYIEVAEYTYEDRNPARETSTKAGRDKLRRHAKGAFESMQCLLMNPKHWRGLMKAYLEAAQTHPAVRSGLVAAIGYCLGGQCCLEHLRAGDNLQAIVSFHGLLVSRPFYDVNAKPRVRMTAEDFEELVDAAPNNYNADCKVLIENGDHDDDVPLEHIDVWKQEMDKHDIDWRFNNHARTPHGFALAPGVIATRYTEAADRRSTLSMLSLFAEVWPEFPQYPVEANACGTHLGQHIVTLSKL